MHDNKEFREDVDKANLFGTFLSETFRDSNRTHYRSKFKSKVEDEMKELIKDYKDENNSLVFVNLKNPDQFLKKTKSIISSGEDKTSNILLKNLNLKFKLFKLLFSAQR